MEDKQLFEQFVDKNWESASQEQRLHALQQLENYYADKQKRPACTIKALKMDETDLGGYVVYQDTNSPIIEINQNLIADGSNQFLCMDTLLHEGRHAYQEFAVQNPDVHVNKKEVESWEKNFTNYVGDPPALYYFQPIEIDANLYSFKETYQIYSQHLKGKDAKTDEKYIENANEIQEDYNDYVALAKQMYGKHYLHSINETILYPNQPVTPAEQVTQAQAPTPTKTNEHRDGPHTKSLINPRSLDDKIQKANNKQPSNHSINVDKMLEKFNGKTSSKQKTKSNQHSQKNSNRSRSQGRG